jgi:hypothetical protein
MPRLAISRPSASRRRTAQSAAGSVPPLDKKVPPIGLGIELFSIPIAATPSAAKTDKPIQALFIRSGLRERGTPSTAREAIEGLDRELADAQRRFEEADAAFEKTKRETLLGTLAGAVAGAPKGAVIGYMKDWIVDGRPGDPSHKALAGHAARGAGIGTAIAAGVEGAQLTYHHQRRKIAESERSAIEWLIREQSRSEAEAQRERDRRSAERGGQ